MRTADDSQDGILIIDVVRGPISKAKTKRLVEENPGWPVILAVTITGYSKVLKTDGRPLETKIAPQWARRSDVQNAYLERLEKAKEE